MTHQIPGHAILSDATLQDIEQQQPTSMKALESIQGMGDSKRAAYGKQIIQVVQAYQTLTGSRVSKPTGMSA
jgi:ATP-dependent DNA helicase RecQ